jgi:hypothetical protein
MYNYLKIPAFKSNLTIQDHLSAMKAIQSFVDSYGLDECREYLWKMLHSSLTSECEFYEPMERNDIIFFTQMMEEMAEVLHFMFKNKPR